MKKRPTVHSVLAPSTKKDGVLAIIYRICQQIYYRIFQVVSDVQNKIKKK